MIGDSFLHKAIRTYDEHGKSGSQVGRQPLADFNRQTGA